MAATIIDSLLLEVGIDASKFDKGSKKIDKGTEKLQQTNKKTANSFGSVKKAAIGFFSALAVQTGIVKMVNHVTDLNTQLDITSKNLGTSTKNLKSWQNTAELMGGSAQSVTSTLDMLSKSQTEFLVTGQTGILPYLRALGVSLYDATGKAKPLDDIMLDMADRFGKMDRAKANSFGQMMGIDQGTLNMLLEGRDAVQSTLAAQRAMRKTTDEEAAASTRLSQARSKLNQQFEAVAVVLVTALTPSLISLTETAADFFGFLAEHEGMAKALFIGLAAVITSTLLPSLFAAIAAIGTLISPFLLLIGVIAAVSVAIGLLWDDFDKWSKGGKSALGGFFEFFKKGFKDSGRAFKSVVNAIKKYWDDFTNFFKAAWKFVLALFTGDKKKIADAGKELAEAWANSFLSQFAIVKKAYEALTNLMNEGAKAAKNIKQEGVGSVWGFTKDKILKPLGQMAGNVIAPKAEAKTIQKPFPLPEPNREKAISKAQKSTNAITDIFSGIFLKGEGDYDSVNYGKKHGYKSGKIDFSKMTVSEIMAAQKRGDFNAAGRYQVIKDTFASGVKALGLKGDEKFTPELQDKFFIDYLMKIKRPDMYKYISGKSNNKTAAQIASAQEWASFGVPIAMKGSKKQLRKGESYYAGDGINNAHVTPEAIGNALDKARAHLTNQAKASVSGNSTINTNTVNNNIQKMEVYTTANTIKGVTDDANVATRNRTSQLGLGMM